MLKDEIRKKGGPLSLLISEVGESYPSFLSL